MKILVLLAMAAAPVFAGDVAVSVTIGEPGFYGRVDLGDYPRPRLVYAEPRVIRVYPEREVREPVYLRVPPGHEKHWDKHCAEYDACGVPVYFIEDRWYNDVYVPEYRARHGRPDHPGKGHGKDKHKDHDRDHDHDHDHD